MAFSDPANNFFSPASGGREESRGTSALRMEPIPEVQNISSPRSMSVRDPGSVSYKEDKTWETIFKGVAKVAGDVTQGVDTVIKLDLDKTLREGVDNIRQAHIFEGTAQLEGALSTANKTDELPVGVRQGMDRIDTLTKAKRFGSISDTNYLTQVADLVSGVKTRYSGYTKEIDEKIKSIVGVDPANALRASIVSDIDALRTQQASQQNKWDTYVAQKGSKFPVGYENMTEAEIRMSVAKTEKSEHDLDMYKKQYDLLTEHGLDARSQTKDNYSKQLNRNVAVSMNATMDSFAKKLGPNWLDDIALGKMNPESRKAAIAGVDKLIRSVDTAAVTLANSPASDKEPGTTFASVITRGGKQKELDDAIEWAKRPLMMIKKAVEEGDAVSLKLATAQLKAMESEVGLEMHRQNPELMQLEVLQKAIGPAAYNTLLTTKDTGLMEPSIRVSKDIFRIKNTKEVALEGKSLSDSIKESREKNISSPQVNREIINRPITLLTSKDPLTTPEVKANAAKSIFLDNDPGFLLRNTPPSQKMDVYTKLVNEETRAAVKGLGPDIYQNYTKWADENFKNVFKDTASTIVYNVTSSPYYTIAYDPESNRIKTTLTNDGVRYQAGGGGLVSAVIPKQTADAVSKLNAGLASIEGVYKDAGIDPKMATATLIRDLSLEEKNMKKEGFFYTIDKAIFDKTMPVIENEIKGINKMKDNILKTAPPALREYLKNSYAPEDSKVTDLPSLILQGESKGNFNLLWGGKEANLTSMTVDEVLSMQGDMAKSGAKSTAAGGPQIIRKTLAGLKKELGLKGDEMFSEGLQAQMMEKLLERRGLKDYKAGKISRQQFTNNLAKEFAALPTSDGKSYYDGDGLNKAQVTLKDLTAAINQIPLDDY